MNEWSPIGNPKFIFFSSFRWCGRVFRRVALFYCVRRKRVFIAMGNENVDFRTLHFHCDFNEIPLGPPGSPKDSPELLLEVSKAFPGTSLASKDGRSRDPLGPPWAPLGSPRNAPGRFLNAQGSLGALQCHLGTLFSRPGVLQDIVFQRYCIKASGILRMTFR